MPKTTPAQAVQEITAQPYKAQIEKRLVELKSEFESGQTMLGELEAKQAELRTTLLRISGAIQVCQEFLAQPEETPEGKE